MQVGHDSVQLIFIKNVLTHVRCKILKKQMVPCKSAAKEVHLNGPHHRIFPKDSKVRTALQVSIIDSVSEWV